MVWSGWDWTSENKLQFKEVSPGAEAMSSWYVRSLLVGWKVALCPGHRFNDTLLNENMNYWVSDALMWEFVCIYYIFILYSCLYKFHVYICILTHYAFQHFNTIFGAPKNTPWPLGPWDLSSPPVDWMSVTSNFTTLQQNAQRILGFKVVITVQLVISPFAVVCTFDHRVDKNTQTQKRRQYIHTV